MSECGRCGANVTKNCSLFLNRFRFSFLAQLRLFSLLSSFPSGFNWSNDPRHSVISNRFANQTENAPNSITIQQCFYTVFLHYQSGSWQVLSARIGKNRHRHNIIITSSLVVQQRLLLFHFQLLKSQVSGGVYRLPGSVNFR